MGSSFPYLYNEGNKVIPPQTLPFSKSYIPSTLTSIVLGLPNTSIVLGSKGCFRTSDGISIGIHRMEPLSNHH